MNQENVTGCLVLSFVVMLILIALSLPFLHYSTTRAGEHSGYVTAIEQSGFFFHNYNVYFKTDNSSSQEDVYCVPQNDIELADKLRQANKERKQVVIRYDGVRAFGLGLCTNDKIISVE